MSGNGSQTQIVTSSIEGPNPSVQMQALVDLSQGMVSLFQVAFKSVSNFALEHSECTLASRPTGAGEQKMVFHLSKAADLATDLYLEVKCPKLTGGDGAGDLESYVWGLGFAMIKHCRFLVSNHSQEDLNGDWLELHDELHGVPGKRMEEAVFKYDNVTLPEMAALSAQGPTLYVPIPFWWTKGTHCALPVISLNCYDMDVEITLRKIDEIIVTLAGDLAGTTAGFTARKWDDFEFTMWVGSVFLDTAERNTFANAEHAYVMKTVQSYNSYTSDTGTAFPAAAKSTLSVNNLSFQHPTSSLVWAIADPNRKASEHLSYLDGDNKTGKLYSAGVRALYGEMASATVSGEVTESIALGADFNVLREGHKSVATITSTTGANGGALSNANLMSSAAVKTWRRDGLNNCLHLPGNRFDYRSSDGTRDVEPLGSLSLTLNSNDRVNTSLKGEHYRVVQGQHFNNIPRKGIYCYSFALNASSPFPQGTINFSRIDTINMEFTKGDSVPATKEDSTVGANVGCELLLFSEHFNIWKVGQNSVGKAFGS